MNPNLKNILVNYYNSFEWIMLSVISHFPTHLIRNLFLRLFGLRIKDVVLYSGFHIRKPSKINIGSGTVLGHGITLDGRKGIKIGKNVNFSSNVMIWTLQHDYNDPAFGVKGGQVIIEDYVWISVRAIILPNITIGKGAVVAAGAVVTKNVEPYTIVGGIPAKKIGTRTKDLHYIPKEIGYLPII